MMKAKKFIPKSIVWRKTMSEHFMYLFPCDPLLPKPDLQMLQRELLHYGFWKEPKGNSIAETTLWELWHSVVIQEHGINDFEAGVHFPDPLDLRSFIDGLKQVGIVPHSYYFAHDRRRGRTPAGYYDGDALSVPVLIEELRDNGWVSKDFSFNSINRYVPGPLYYAFCVDGQLEPVGFFDETHTFVRYGECKGLWFEDYGETITVHAGENFCEPTISDGGRKVDDWSSFIESWLKDPAAIWHDPETGKPYGLWDLDFQNTLGAGTCALVIDQPGLLSGEKAAGLLSRLSGQRFEYSLCHL
ncbi:hypothetical protein [Paenibacillus elgii]|uniref:hypothetical protein n=1 Tax=Paenibacillus elgii TaxID=189691 RepID=UPI000FDA0BE4|nr:hypothetical protein [Paenibacillus elgii]NEN80816.1 hypothetical protein [Paenibacillus elgii]